MAAFSSLYDFVMSHQPCTQAMADLAIRESVIKFCERSWLYRYTHPDIALVAGTGVYTMIPEAGAQIGGVIYADVDGNEIDGATEPDLDMLYPAWRTTDRGTPQYYLMERGQVNKIRFVPTPHSAGVAKVTVWQKPLHSATSFPDFIYNDFLDAIRYGALYELYGYGSVKWFNPAIADNYRIRAWAMTPGPDISTTWPTLVM